MGAPTQGSRVGLPVGDQRYGVVEERDAGVEQVIHLAGIFRESWKETFETAHHEGTGRLMRAAREAKVRHVVYVSALGAAPAGAGNGLAPSHNGYTRSLAAGHRYIPGRHTESV
jgi:nucleoside-diphosphate-sugar epimerase